MYKIEYWKDFKVKTFIAPTCDIVKIQDSLKGWGFDLFVFRTGGWKFHIIGKSYYYDKIKGFLIIEKENLPVILEVRKENIIDNTKKWLVIK